MLIIYSYQLDEPVENGIAEKVGCNKLLSGEVETNGHVPQPRHLPRSEACRDRLRRLRPLRQPARAPDTAGRRPGYLLMQNSGLGNCINALASLDMLYGIPLLMIISHRGGKGEPIVGQVPMGRLTVPLLQTLDIPYQAPASGEGEEAVVASWEEAQKKRRPAAVLLDLDYWRRA